MAITKVKLGLIGAVAVVGLAMPVVVHMVIGARGSSGVKSTLAQTEPAVWGQTQELAASATDRKTILTVSAARLCRHALSRRSFLFSQG